MLFFSEIFTLYVSPFTNNMGFPKLARRLSCG
jgi:hypothetical protein